MSCKILRLVIQVNESYCAHFPCGAIYYNVRALQNLLMKPRSYEDHLNGSFSIQLFSRAWRIEVIHCFKQYYKSLDFFSKVYNGAVFDGKLVVFCLTTTSIIIWGSIFC